MFVLFKKTHTKASKCSRYGFPIYKSLFASVRMINISFFSCLEYNLTFEGSEGRGGMDQWREVQEHDFGSRFSPGLFEIMNHLYV